MDSRHAQRSEALGPWPPNSPAPIPSSRGHQCTALVPPLYTPAPRAAACDAVPPRVSQTSCPCRRTPHVSRTTRWCRTCVRRGGSPWAPAWCGREWLSTLTLKAQGASIAIQHSRPSGSKTSAPYVVGCKLQSSSRQSSQQAMYGTRSAVPWAAPPAPAGATAGPGPAPPMPRPPPRCARSAVRRTSPDGAIRVEFQVQRVKTGKMWPGVRPPQ